MADADREIEYLINLESHYNPKTNVVLKPKMNALVFKGGGEKGIAYGGAVKYFEEKGLLEGVDKFGGSSAGGLAAAYLALGYSGEDITKLFAEDFQDLLGIKTIVDAIKTGIEGLPDLLNREHFGLIRMDKILETFREKVRDKFETENIEDPTFEDLFKHKGKDLRLVLVNAVTGKREVFSYLTTPDCSIAKAMAGTMACPPVFEAVTIDGKKYYDGGIVENNPAQLFNHSDDVPEGYELNERGYNPGMVNFRVDSKLEQAQIWQDGEELSKQEAASSIFEYLNRIVTQFQGEAHINDEGPQAISLYNQGYGTFEVPVTSEMIEKLKQEGYEQSKEWYNNYCLGTVYDIKQYNTIFEHIENYGPTGAKERAGHLETAITHLLQNDSIEAKERIELLSSELAVIKSVFSIGIKNSKVLEIVLNTEKNITIREKSYDINGLFDETKQIEDEIDNMLNENPDLKGLGEKIHTKKNEYISPKDTFTHYIQDPNYKIASDDVIKIFLSNCNTVKRLRADARKLVGNIQEQNAINKRIVEVFNGLMKNIESSVNADISSDRDEIIENFKNIYRPIKSFLSEDEKELLKYVTQQWANEGLLTKDSEVYITIIEFLNDKLGALEKEGKENLELLQESQNEFEVIKKTHDQCERIINRLDAFPEAAKLYNKVERLSNQLERFIDKHSNVLTQLISGLFKLFNINLSYAPANVFYIQQAKRLKNDLEDIQSYNLIDHSKRGIHDLDDKANELINEAKASSSPVHSFGFFVPAEPVKNTFHESLEMKL